MTDGFAAAASARCASVWPSKLPGVSFSQPAFSASGASAQVRPHERVAVQAVARVQGQREPLPESVDRERGELARVGAEL